MIIVSRFKDYYDGGAVYGVDSQRRYIRDIIEVEFKHKYNFSIVGFCGKLYPLDNIISMSYSDPKKYTNYDPEFEFLEVKKNSFSSDYKLVPASKFAYTNWMTGYRSSKPKRGHWEEAKVDKEYLDLFHIYKVPIFYVGKTNSIEGTKLVLNPCLNNVAFYKVMDTTQAFQEIEMYLSNVLVESDVNIKVPVGSDNVIRDSKGFDKMSFRKEKEK